MTDPATMQDDPQRLAAFEAKIAAGDRIDGPMERSQNASVRQLDGGEGRDPDANAEDGEGCSDGRMFYPTTEEEEQGPDPADHSRIRPSRRWTIR